MERTPPTLPVPAASSYNRKVPQAEAKLSFLMLFVRLLCCCTLVALCTGEYYSSYITCHPIIVCFKLLYSFSQPSLGSIC